MNSSPPLPDGIAVAKRALRERIWRSLDRHGAVQPPGAAGHIPTFVGADAAADRLAGVSAWTAAHVIKANPDRAQLPVRVHALHAGKTVYMAVPRLESVEPFYLLDPSRLGPDADLRAVATGTGAASGAPRVRLEQMRPVDLIVCGSVAVDQELRKGSQLLGEEISRAESRNAELASIRQDFLDGLPNIPDEDVPAGGKEANVVVRESGAPHSFDFKIRDHVELAESLGLVDYKRGAKLNGTGSWVYMGAGAQLEWALLNYFVQTHLRDGYTFVLPPHILTQEAGYAAGQFPKFAEDVYVVEEDEEGAPSRFLIPTSETALLSLHRDEILRAEDLPRKYFAYSPCYRKEIGGYRTHERGTLRGHQFDKVEMFQFTTPDTSADAHEELLAKAEELVRGLGLHYRISLLAAGDTGASMAKTYDVEVWIPSIGRYLEVSSVSNARDYQARRGRIRYRDSDGKPRLVHTLNGSGLATSRLLPAVLEQNQQVDGSVRVPEVLQAWAPAVLSPSVR